MSIKQPSNKQSNTTLSTTLLRCKSLSCERDGRILFEGLALDVNQGDIIQIEGPNGAGKTTLLRAITGLFPDYKGDITWKGESTYRVRADFLGDLLFIGHLAGVKKTLTPRENLLFLTQLSNQSYESTAKDAIDSALAKVGLYGYEDLPGYQLSAGQLRRVGLARLYLSSSPLWVLDEPYTAIDKEGIAHLEQLFIDHANKGGALILTSHQAPNIPHLKRINLLDFPAQISADEDAMLEADYDA